MKRYRWCFVAFFVVELTINLLVVLWGTPMVLPLFQDPEGGISYYWVWFVGRVQLFNWAGIIAALVQTILAITLTFRVHKRIKPGDARDYEALPMLIQDTSAEEDGPLAANMGDATHAPSPLRRARLDSGDGMRPVDAAAPRWIGWLRRVVLFVAITFGAVSLYALFVGLAALGGAMGGPRQLTRTAADCNPLSGGADAQAPCMLPFPSSIYLKPDSATPTGRRVAFTAGAMPQKRWPHHPVDPAAWNENDGFSTMAPLLFTVGGNGAAINSSSLVGHDRIADSTNPALSTTLLLDITDVTNPVPLPHWTEVDSFQPADRPAGVAAVLVLQPAAPLHFNRTYVAAARGIAGQQASSPFPPQPFFEKLVSGGGHVDCGEVPADRCQFMVQQHNDLVAPALLAVGWHNDDGAVDAQVGWDFSTISRANSLARFEAMRDDALSVVGDGDDIVYSIDLVEEHSESKCAGSSNTTAGNNAGADGSGSSSSSSSNGARVTIGRTVWGHFLAPNYMSKAGNGVNLRLTKNVAGPDGSGKAMPVQNGEVRVPFEMRIPCSLLTATNESGGNGNNANHNNNNNNNNGQSEDFGPASSAVSSSASMAASTTAKMLVQYGHGLMGDRSEVESSYLGDQADANQWILVASEWEGMSQYDLLQAARVFATRMEEFHSVPETTLQGWVNKQVALKLYRGALVSNEHLKNYAGNPMLKHGADQPIGYYGNSQGSVIGGGYFASSLELERGTLGVPGSPFALLLTRSKDFEQYNTLLKLQLKNEVDLRLTLSLVQQIWDVAESAGWLQTAGGDNAPGLPRKQVLMQAGLGDAQVTPLGAEVMARGWKAGGLNMSLLNTPIRPVFGLDVHGAAGGSGTLPHGASGLVEYSFHKVPPAPFEDVAADGETDTHECVRRNYAAQKQMKLFLEAGVIQQFCSHDDCSNMHGCHDDDDCQICQADGLLYCCSDPACNLSRMCASNAGLKSCACPA